MRSNRLLSLILIVLMAAFMLPAVSMAESQAVTKTGWTVTGSENIENQTIIVKGSLTVKSGGRLNLNNSTLLVDSDGRILAEEGSQFVADNSKIKSNSPGKTFYSMYIKCDNASLQNCEISGLGDAALVTGKGVMISGCTIGGALSLNNAQNCRIENNKFYQESTPARFQNMIQMDNAINNSLVKNTIYGGNQGIYCTYSWNNTFDSNTWYAQEEKYIGKSPDSWWNEQYINGGATGNAIWLDAMSNNNTVTNNNSYGASCTGYRITQSSSNTFKGNTARGNRVGLVLNFASNNVVDDNRFYDIWEYEAVQMYRSRDNHVINNYVRSAQVGVGLISSKENTVSGNRLESCGIGLNIIDSSSNIISGNALADIVSSIIADYSKDNTISGNNIVDSRLKASVCEGNILNSNYWDGATEAEDRSLDATASIKANNIKKAAAPSIVPEKYSSPDRNSIFIDKDTVWENKTVELGGDLYIADGVSLTLKNVTLLYKPGTYSSSHTTIGTSGGSLYIYDSKLVGMEYDKDFTMELRNCKNFVMSNSTVYYMSDWEGGGAITIREAENADIQKNTFIGCYQAATIDMCKNVVFSDNVIDKSYLGISLKPAAGSMIKVQNNRFDRAAYTGMRLWGNHGNLSSPSVVSGNVITNSRGCGIWNNLEQMGIRIQNSSFENVMGPSMLSNNGIGIDHRAFRPIAVEAPGVEKGKPVELYFAVTGVRQNLFKEGTSGIADVHLTLNGKVISSKSIIIKPGEMSIVEFSTNAPADGTYGMIFANEKRYAEPGPDSWAADEISEAEKAMLVPVNMNSGYKKNITRADFCRLAVNLIVQKTGKSIEQVLAEKGLAIDHNAFVDTFDPEVLAANALGIVNGVGGGRFNPKGSIVRQDAASMLFRTASVLGITASGIETVKFSDSTKISGYAKTPISFVAALKDKNSKKAVMGGTGGGSFSPLDTYTRQQAYVTMMRLFNAK